MSLRFATALAAAMLTAAPLITAVAKEPAAATSGLSSRIQGEWKVVLTPEEKAQLDAMKLAFRDPPPTEAEIAALSQEEQMLVGIMLMAVQAEPDGEKVAEMKAVMQGLDNMKLTVTPDTMTMAIGDQGETAKWKVKSESDAGLVILTTDAQGQTDELTIALDGSVLTMTGAPDREGDPPKVMRFSR